VFSNLNFGISNIVSMSAYLPTAISYEHKILGARPNDNLNIKHNTKKIKDSHPVSDFLCINHDSGFETPNFIVKVFYALPSDNVIKLFLCHR
jgi:hypothetical protein